MLSSMPLPPSHPYRTLPTLPPSLLPPTPIKPSPHCHQPFWLHALWFGFVASLFTLAYCLLKHGGVTSGYTAEDNDSPLPESIRSK